MGLFSGSKKEYTGGAELEHIFNEIPNVISKTIVRAVMQGSSISEDINAAHLNGFNSMAAKYLSYGKKYYTNGLPEGDKSYGIVNFSRIKEVLDTVVGTPVTIRFAQVDDPQYIRYAAEYCQKHYGWEYVTGELSNPPTGVKPVKIVRATNNGTTLTMTFSHNPKVGYVMVANTVGTNSSIGAYGYTPVTVITYSYFTVSIPLDISGLSYHVEYTLDSDLANPQKVYLWNYSANLNTHPELSDVSTFKYESQYYPIVPFIVNRVSLINRPANPLYITGNKMLKKIGLTMKDITTAVLESNAKGNTRKSTTTVDDAFYMFALNMNTTLPEGKEYLFKYWKQEANENARLPLGIAPVVATNNSILFRLTNTATPSTLIDSPATKTIKVSDNNFNVEIKYSGITNYRTKNKVIGKINTVTLVKTILPKGVVETSNTNLSIIYSSIFRTYYERSYITIEKQISASETETIKVFGLSHRTVTTSGWTVDATLSSGSFFLPVNYDIVKTFSGIDESKILMESASIYIYWTNVTKVKTGGFFGSALGRIIMIIIIIIIIIISYGGASSFAAALATYAAEATVAIVLTDLAIALAISYGLKKLGEIGGIFAVIAAVAAMYYFKVGVFAQNSATLAEPSWAESLLNAVTMISNEFSNIIARDMKELMEDVGDFLKTSADKTAELEKAQDLLDNSKDNSFDPFFILRQVSYFNPDESPTAFYNRTLNTNPGVASLDYISMYTMMSLQLPTYNGLNEVTTNNEYAYNG